MVNIKGSLCSLSVRCSAASPVPRKPKCDLAHILTGPITHKESGISDTDPGESFAESEVPGTESEAFSGVCASNVLLNCSLGAVSGAIPDVRAAIESLSFFSIISPTFWVKYSRRCENTRCGSGSLDSGIEDPRVEVLEIVVEGGSLFSRGGR